MADYDYTFDVDDSNNTAASVYRLARSGGTRVLDLGSGPGVIAAALEDRDGKHVTCVDSSASALAAAHQRGVESLVRADLGTAGWAPELDGQTFDVIVIADVLEHLIVPEALVQSIVDRGLLDESGYLVISIPNAGHEAVLAELIKGRFTYQETGLLDSTHLRFFTLASLRELLERCGFFITQVERTRRTAEQTSLAVHDVSLPTELRDLLLEASPEAQTYQFIVRAERADAARDLAIAREQLRRAEAELAERDRVTVRREVAEAEALRDEAIARATELEAAASAASRDRDRLEQSVADLERALRRERKLTATERKRYEHALAEAKRTVGRDQVAAAEKQIARLERKLDDVYQSRTWKVGRAAWTAFHVPARILRRRRPEAPPVTPAPAVEPEKEVVDYTLVENTVVRSAYEAAVAKRAFNGSRNRVVFAVYTDDLDAGRGDLFTAIGLGRNLERSGYEVIYLPQDRWYDIPAGTDIYVAMLETVDPMRLPGDLTTVAWVRNQTSVWVTQPWLPLFDMVLASSQQSLDALRKAYPGPMGLLPIGVDTELFTQSASPQERAGVVSTVNQWGREREVFAFLKEQAAPFPLALYGRQRGIAARLEPHAKGPVSYFSLPSLYNQASVVLDDFNHTTAGYGNVNSRVFEAAACGAIVLTNRSAGLDALGLGDIGVFGSARELFALIDDRLTSTEASKGAEALRRIVVERHSYRQRAQEFDEHVRALGAERAHDTGVVISHFPDYRDNPFAEMVWSHLRERGSIAIPVGNELNFTATIRAAEYRPTVFHLNWTAPILGAAGDDHDRLVRYRRVLEAIDEMHASGIPSVWTVHNVLPHECADPELEAQLRQEIADRVDAIHVMCPETVAACAQWYELPQSKVRVIPHPGYIDVYPNLMDRATARHELGLAADEFVYLHFGQVRAYKGIDRMLDAFEQVSHIDPQAKLVMVGKPGRFEGVKQIMDRARANPAVMANFNPVADADVQLYMNAADVVVLPHQAALNSGALLLAYSFARPVIAPDTGCLAGLVDDLTGVRFDPGGGSLALQNAMLSARELTTDHGKAAYRRAAEFHYLGIARQFAGLVDEVLSLRR
ncbi:MAG: methyltransferase domain-containing protein [Acidimicrobiia bacterium]|nr:methyltransferase domain-containing protein [Acidimicrobiia bacterium]